VKIDALPATEIEADLIDLGLEPRFAAVLMEMAQTAIRKGHDYASAADPYQNAASASEWGIPAWVGVGIRMNDKLNRLKALSRNGVLKNESAEDSFLDLAVYGVIGLILLRQRQGVK
jgi:hypothetical protein